MFQFQCPQCANVLQADPAQAGQQSQCPICQTLFIIPAPLAPPASQMSPRPGDFFPQTSGPGHPPTENPGTWPAPGPPSGTPAPQVPAAGPVELKEPDELHIPCPECQQLLETPVEMLDQEVLCPYCQAQFCLRRRDSVEYKRRRQQELEMRERKAGKAWLNWAIVVVVLVVIFLLFLIIST
ncbi:MAG: hypothetical protein JJ992_28325, partial [Planctomycetes bacterium]|nr:hypothetical protein [Planctomycetota bacterium]